MKAKEFVKTLTGNQEQDALSFIARFKADTTALIEARKQRDGKISMQAFKTVVEQMRMWCASVEQQSENRVIIAYGITAREIHQHFDSFKHMIDIPERFKAVARAELSDTEI